MPATIEPATTGRSKCRGCGRPIAAGDLRLGERLPNPFADDDSTMTHWFHLRCGAFRRPEAFLEAIQAMPEPPPERDALVTEAERGVAHHRLPRVDRAERATSGRASCRACRTPIAKGSWRIALVYYEEGRFVPSGFIHVACAREYLEDTDLLPRLRHFSAELVDADIAAIAQELQSGSDRR